MNAHVAADNSYPLHKKVGPLSRKAPLSRLHDVPFGRSPSLLSCLRTPVVSRIPAVQPTPAIWRLWSGA